MQQKQRRITTGLALGSSGPLEWYVLNDVVMGGRSESAVHARVPSPSPSSPHLEVFYDQAP